MGNLPSRVKVGYAVYDVIAMLPAEIDEVGAGVCNHRTCVIKIDTTQHWQKQIETLWHEIKHAIHVSVDLGDESKEEDYCSRSAPAEIAVFLDNPSLRQIIWDLAISQQDLRY